MPEANITENEGALIYTVAREEYIKKVHDSLAKASSIWDRDAEFKLKVRKIFAWVFPIFLLIQNIVTAGLEARFNNSKNHSLLVESRAFSSFFRAIY